MLQVTSYKLQASRGFTLVETLAALGIFVFITLIVFVGNNRFNNTITEADDVSFVLFADANRNQYYEKPGEFLERYLIRRGNGVSNLYWLDSFGSASPLGAGGVDISFERPDPDASFVFFDCDGNIVSHNAQAVRLEVISPAGLTKNIKIETTGQISVQ
ncbi:MAG: hypothetical protein CEO19_483 [Parcubacteria group bacterium Gr01-1014_73]|nr:MAG: hypothetical protein CEO19_483 [Parcubacteria group bacterium Gr01-1014_73]